MTMQTPTTDTTKVADNQNGSSLVQNDPAIKKSKESDPKAGLALVLAFLAVAAFLYLSPEYFENLIATRIVSATLAAIGVMGLGVELSRLNNKGKKIGLDNLGIGLILLAVWVVVYHFLGGHWWANALILPFLLIPAYGTALGVIEIVGSLLTSQSSGDGSQAKQTLATLFIKIFLALAQIVGFILALLQIGQILKVVP